MRPVPHFWILVASMNGFISVAMAAISAHIIADSHLSALAEKGSSLELLHAVVLLSLASTKGSLFAWARWLFLGGIILFSGSLYTLALGGPPAIASLAPIGGMTLMAAWMTVAVASQHIAKD